MKISSEECRDFSASSKLEWLETNGTGAFAMGTVAGVNTRRYHALLVASLRPPVERYVLLSRVEEELNGEFPLGASQYPGVVAPRGFEWIEEFSIEPCATWTYRCGSVALQKQVWLVEGTQAVAIRYTATEAVTLRVRPFFAFRDYHSLTARNDSWNRVVRVEEGRITIRPYESLPEVTLALERAVFKSDPHWYENIEYLAELDRGLEFREDQFTPGAFSISLEAGKSVTMTCGVGLADSPEPPAQRKHPADEFRVRRADGKPTIIAGYPWFTDWGRDTMISLPGLLLTRGDKVLREEARAILEGFLGYLDQGLIPNRFPDAGEVPAYNTCDATLWMFQAVHEYQRAGGDPSFFFGAAREILDSHHRGTHYDIRVDPEDRLLRAGSAGTQLTWMDAKVGDWVVTPRHGKPVEINALWYNALRLSAKWLADPALDVEADAMAQSFRARFWNPQRGCLFDVLDGDPAASAKLRPNQILAVSLPHSPLTAEQQRAVVAVVERELLTPFGLRTLERGDPDYKGRYRGSPLERDGAYHQGTVWPWLIGPFVEAYLRVNGRSAESLAHVRGILEPLSNEFARSGLGSLAEVYDGDEPHQPGGCPAQAWSVSEWLRATALANPATSLS